MCEGCKNIFKGMFPWEAALEEEKKKKWIEINVIDLSESVLPEEIKNFIKDKKKVKLRKKKKILWLWI